MLIVLTYSLIKKIVYIDASTDVFVLGNYSLLPKSVISCRPIGVLLSEDQDGIDSKIIAVPLRKIDPMFSDVIDIDDVLESMRMQLKHFIEHHKDLEEGKYVTVTGWQGKKDAETNIDIAMLSSLEEQSFVIGDVLKTVDELYSAHHDIGPHGKEHIKKPKYVLIFVDEINRFLPKDRYVNRHNAVGEYITKIWLDDPEAVFRSTI